jgi:hypothetical protein
MIKSGEMKRFLSKLFFATVFLVLGFTAVSQEVNDSIKTAVEIVDSLKRIGVIYGDSHRKPEITLTTGQAIKVLEEKLQPGFWQNTNDPLRKALMQLVFQASNPPYDSSEVFLKKFPYDSLKVSWDKLYMGAATVQDSGYQ